MQGTLRDEQDFLAAWSYGTYLWFDELVYPEPSSHASALDYFSALKTSATTTSGKAKDRFHFTYPTADWDALINDGLVVGYGIEWSVERATPPRSVLVKYIEPDSPAGRLAPPLARGTQVLSVDGVDVLNGSDVDTINAGLQPATANQSHTLQVREPGATQNRTFSLVSARYATTPVQNVKVLSTASGKVGYLQFNDHVAVAESALVSAMNRFKSESISDLVIDVRYNGGGQLYIASALAYMVAGPASTTGKTFESLTTNGKFLKTVFPDPSALVPMPFFDKSEAGTGSALPGLGLKRVFVLTGAQTCSASESIINGLRGVGVEVIQIGSPTCGKPYGFYPQDNCGTTYFTIQFKGVNAKGFGDYSDGFAPQNGKTTGLQAQAILPGCQVADDFSHALGDPAEARLAAALQYRSAGQCPLPSGLATTTASSRPSAIAAAVIEEKPVVLEPRMWPARVVSR